MTAKLMNGKELAQNLRKNMKAEVALLKEKKNLVPHLTVILVGDNPASLSYVNGKKKAAAEVGISSQIIKLPKETSKEDLLKVVNELNEDQSVHGILIQLPLPNHIPEQQVIEAINPLKDVDGFHPINIGRMMTNQDTLLPCTPYGILTMLRSEDIIIEGKHAVIIGRSNIVGKPVGQLLLNENATVTYTHSKTVDIKAITNEADIVIAAVGKQHFVDASFIKEGAAVIDVGIHRTEDGKLTGDVEFESVKEKAGYITPVPGGVGPMTITMLLYNTIKACKGLKNIA